MHMFRTCYRRTAKRDRSQIRKRLLSFRESVCNALPGSIYLRPELGIDRRSVQGYYRCGRSGRYVARVIEVGCAARRS